MLLIIHSIVHTFSIGLGFEIVGLELRKTSPNAFLICTLQFYSKTVFYYFNSFGIIKAQKPIPYCTAFISFLFQSQTAQQQLKEDVILHSGCKINWISLKNFVKKPVETCKNSPNSLDDSIQSSRKKFYTDKQRRENKLAFKTRSISTKYESEGGWRGIFFFCEKLRKSPNHLNCHIRWIKKREFSYFFQSRLLISFFSWAVKYHLVFQGRW